MSGILSNNQPVTFSVSFCEYISLLPLCNHIKICATQILVTWLTSDYVSTVLSIYKRHYHFIFFWKIYLQYICKRHNILFGINRPLLTMQLSDFSFLSSKRDNGLINIFIIIAVPLVRFDLRTSIHFFQTEYRELYIEIIRI